MTEAEWDDCTDPNEMVRFLWGTASDRQVRLMASAYCRLLWGFMGKASRKAVILGEQMVDEPVHESHREAVVRAAVEAVCRFEEGSGDFFMAADMAYRIPCNDGWYAAAWTIGNWSPPLASGVLIVRDIIGNPFRPARIEPAWLTWNDGTVVKLAQNIYDERAFDQMPILGDALQDAGCETPEVLDHCRQAMLHVRGCWLLDLLTDRS
jgi:hypothetical protein